MGTPATCLTHLECGACGAPHPADRLQNLSPCCARPLLARYDLERVRETFPRTAAEAGPASLWRYGPLLPVGDPTCRVTLGEGWCPLLRFPDLVREPALPRFFIKDEAGNPTGSFKARGMAAAISRALELGAAAVALPSAGNAAGAAAAYAAQAGLPCHVFMPADTPAPFRLECQAFGAHVTLIDGLITDCGKVVAQRKEAEGWFDLSTLKEPYRLEGKKTMGYELAEQGGWTLPDVIVYPTGGGTGLIGMWKAFAEMEALGWLEPAADGRVKKPRMVSVQAAGCAPIVEAFERGLDHGVTPEAPHTLASGLRVPAAVGDFLILQALRESEGTAVAVPDAEMLTALTTLAAGTGVCPAPEGAAAFAATVRLAAEGWIRPEESVVLFNTGTGLKYPEALAAAVAD